jgi:DNA polymerase
MSAATKQQKLDQIRADIISQNICPDLAKQATQLVFGDGNPDADIVFIGEAPGKNEDLQGKPFVGAAGKFLNEMLEMIGLARDDVYITNIVKYRPPNNRDPLPDEKAAFLPFLETQLEAIKPKLVITLGRHSLNCFLPDMQISQVHGQPKRIRVKGKGLRIQKDVVGQPGVDAMQGGVEQQTESYKEYGEGVAEPATQQRATNNSKVGSLPDDQTIVTWVILPLFHPAAALYNGGMRQTLIDDFARIPMILEKLR